MPQSLIEALERLARKNGYRSPRIILAENPPRRRPKPVLYWTRD